MYFFFFSFLFFIFLFSFFFFFFNDTATTEIYTLSLHDALPISSGKPIVVLPSYNGARRLPVLTPLLAGLVARRGLPVVIHGTSTASSRIFVRDVLHAIDVQPAEAAPVVRDGQVAFLPTEMLCPGLKRLLDARRVIGLRNSAH